MIEKFHIIPHPLFNGNKTETFYNYTPSLRRLNNLNVKTSDGNDLFNNKYEFDKVGNVTSLLNTAGITANDMAGNYSHNFKYDEFNRLAYAEGNFEGSTNQLDTGNDANSKYALKMQYNTTHGIVTKTQEHAKNGSPFMPNTYDNVYKYITDTHKVEAIVNNATGEAETFKYDANGNITVRNDNNAHRELFWDESNRLRVVSDNHSMQHYIYDGSGERVLKANSDMEAVYENGELVNTPSTVSINGYTSYPSAFIVITADGVYSKHYYAGAQRIVSRLGDNDASIFESGCVGCKQEPSATPFDDNKLKQAQILDLNVFAEKAKKGKVTLKEYKPISIEEQEKAMAEYANRAFAPPSGAGGLYYYHPDHLGTSTALTDFNGNAYQFFLNLPFGETLAQQLGSNYYNSPFKFNGKELDEETGFYYYGARYYDPKISIWLSVDPLAEVTMQPYSAFNNNPIRYNDPTVMIAEDPGDIYSSDGKYLKNDGKDDKKVYVVDVSKIETKENGTRKWFKKDQKEVKGMTNEELNLRASLSTLKQTEAGRVNEPLDYNTWNNNKNFTEDSYAENPEAYKSHPGTNPDSGGSAAGAYQFLKRFYKESDFSPQNQDKAAVNNMTSKSYSAALSGNITNFRETTKGRWTSLDHWTVPQLQKVFTSYIAKELSGSSTIATPIGSLLKK